MPGKTPYKAEKRWEGVGGARENNGPEWCKKGESGVKWGIERGIHAQILGEGW